MTEPGYDLYTSSFRYFEPHMGTPVRISNGIPKYALGYEMPYSLKNLMPRWQDMKIPMPEFERRYLRGLGRFGVQFIDEQFENLARIGGNPNLVLLCFENLAKPGAVCHRTMFANWWKEQTGQEVTELQEVAPPPPPIPTLFDDL